MDVPEVEKDSRDTAAIRLPLAFHKVWIASTVSNLGDGMRITALPLLAATLTRNPGLVSALTFASFLPWLLVGLPAGAIVDRTDRKSLMMTVDLARAGVVLALGLLVSSGMAHITVLYVAAFLIGAGEVFFDTASQTLLPNVVDPPALERANGRLYSAQLVTNEFVGPPLGGVLFGIAAALPLYVDAATFLIAPAVLATIPGRFRAGSAEVAGEPREIWTEIRDGARWLWRHTLLRTLAWMLAIQNFIAGAVFSIFVLFALEVLDVSNAGYGFLVAAGAVGGVTGGVVADKLAKRIHTQRLIVLALFLTGVAFAGMGTTSHAVVAGAFFAVEGFASVLWQVVTVSLRQSIVPEGLLGRVNSAYRFVGMAILPLGALAGGALATIFDLRTPLVSSGVTLLALGLLASVLVTRELVDAARTKSSAGTGQTG
ncbi:MAG: MFS transporter [Actinomycetota bacterium]